MSSHPASMAVDPAGVPPAGAGDYQAILRDPRFHELVRSRNRFGWSLVILMSVIYFGFILVVAFDKQLLAQKVGGGVTSLGVVVGLAVIVSAFLIIAVYVVRANGRYDELTHALAQDNAR